MPGVKKAELIEGVVHMPSPVRYLRHGLPHGVVVTWLGYYRSTTPGVGFADNTSTRLDSRNEPQPDAMLRIEPELGGQSRISDDDYVEGAPELVVEVSSSSVSIDTNSKFKVYRRNGVREYVVWRVRDCQIDWHVLENKGFVPLQLDEDGRYRSRVFPGLWLDPLAMIRDDLPKVLDVLREGIASPEHEAFVKELAARRGSS